MDQKTLLNCYLHQPEKLKEITFLDSQLPSFSLIPYLFSINELQAFHNIKIFDSCYDKSIIWMFAEDFKEYSQTGFNEELPLFVVYELAHLPVFCNKVVAEDYILIVYLFQDTQDTKYLYFLDDDEQLSPDSHFSLLPFSELKESNRFSSKMSMGIYLKKCLLQEFFNYECKDDTYLFEEGDDIVLLNLKRNENVDEQNLKDTEDHFKRNEKIDDDQLIEMKREHLDEIKDKEDPLDEMKGDKEDALGEMDSFDHNYSSPRSIHEKSCSFPQIKSYFYVPLFFLAYF